MTVPDRYAVIGNPVAHSRSPAIHQRFAEQFGDTISYERILAPLAEFAATLDRFRAAGGLGVNVTVPFKLEAFAYASRHSARAAASGAANCLRLAANEVIGDNTDGVGLVTDLRSRLSVNLAQASVLLLGAGGASRGVLRALLDCGVARLVICNRTAARAYELCALFRDARVQACDFGQLDREQHRHFDLLINATSSSLAAADLPVPGQVFQTAQLAYDMFYSAGPTAFMTQARQAGCVRTSDGLGMLIEQAAESYAVWRGKRPQTAPVYEWLRAQLAGGL